MKQSGGCLLNTISVIAFFAVIVIADYFNGGRLNQTAAYLLRSFP